MPVLARRLLVLLAVAGAGFVPAPATAAGYCSTSSGISVVVDHGALGGGIAKGCDGSGNRNAAQAFENTGHHLTYAQRQPGFVCRVGGVPASDPCVNTSPSDAYWGLYWSDGTSGWKYSSLGAGSLDLPAGATVAFSWQNGGTADPPGVAPASPVSASSPSPTKAPTKKATTSTTTKTSTKASTKPRAAASSVAPSATASPSVGATPTATASATGSPSVSAAAPTAPATTGGPTPSAGSRTAAAAGPVEGQDVADQNGGGLPWFVPAAALVLLAGGAGGATWWRRRATG